MPSRLTSYFGVRRGADLVSTRVKSLLGDFGASAPRSAPADSEPARIASTLDTSTGSRLKIKAGIVHKTKRTRIARTRNAVGKARLTQKKLPAHVRLAYLARREQLEATDFPKSTVSSSSCISVSQYSQSSIDKETSGNIELVKSTGSFESKISSSKYRNTSEIVQTKDGCQKLKVVPQDSKQSLNAPLISMQKPLRDLLKPSIEKEIQALTKSDSCSNTSLKGAVIPFGKDTTATERVEPEAASGFPSPSVLPLPYHMERLLELFRTCETLVSTLHNRSEVCSFDKIKPAVQEVVRCDFTEVTVGRFSAVYPLAYSFRYDRQLDKITKLPLSTYTLVLVPNLRADGTQMALDSPSKGHLVFTGTRLIQRRHVFHDSLLLRVKKAHREFLMVHFGLLEGDLPEDSSLRRWHPAFALDTAVPEVEPVPLPPRPLNGPGGDSRITSAGEAVTTFRARALFREARACEKLVSQEATDERKLGPPTAAAAVTGSSKTSNSAILRGVSAALLAKVRERERQLNSSILTQPVASASERAAYSALPVTVTQIWRELRGASRRPVPISLIATRLVQSSGSGLSLDEAMVRIEKLLTLMPDWVEKVAWVRPYLRFKGNSANRPLREVIDEVKAKAVKKDVP
ncbi:dna replication factor cdt1 [Echinococcus multilocularis]|uniref:Dna replication factor cdt1 n=1 Tax=Echinococcus multilocularis TaxID=6211 RepID=A0A068YBU6_ECHMU|nr:dna replication factor cdt1 [Echinococcus multilocularis]